MLPDEPPGAPAFCGIVHEPAVPLCSELSTERLGEEWLNGEWVSVRQGP